MDIGTILHTWISGKLVGADEFGNRYYRQRGAALYGRERRWVLYKDAADASKVPAEWHAWLHHTSVEPLTEQATKAQPWQVAHQANMTGTAAAYRPRGHDIKGGERAAATGDYKAWVPE